MMMPCGAEPCPSLMCRVWPVAGSSRPSSPEAWAVYHTMPSFAGATSCGCEPLGTANSWIAGCAAGLAAGLADGGPVGAGEALATGPEAGAAGLVEGWAAAALAGAEAAAGFAAAVEGAVGGAVCPPQATSARARIEAAARSERLFAGKTWGTLTQPSPVPTGEGSNLPVTCHLSPLTYLPRCP